MSSSKARIGQLMAIFALSGFSGLIYQSIWSHYLGLSLGHAAYAQSLVLAIYMGGLALGSWLASRHVHSLANAVLAYAVVELAIGVFGFVFHPGFVAYTGFSQEHALPALPANLVHAYQWGTAALLILPQCVLLGTTFPLMASACLRIDDGAQGRSLGGLYFTNSFGAAIGALVATFVLLPAIGMPGAMLVAGVANVIVAALAWSLSRASAASKPMPAATSSTQDGGSRRLLAGVLVAAAITGATSFAYEIAWVRMLNLALGTTLHSFELMLAAFILGLAAGAYWIHRKGDACGNALWLAGVAQVAMGACALASTLAFAQSFRWVGWLVQNLPHTDAGYRWFNFGSAGVALLVMFPAAFFAGSTLPLFTLALLREGQGERSVGRVYAANTLGAIVGVIVVVHLLVPGLGLHVSLLAAATLDIILGIVLLGVANAAPRAISFGAVAGMAMLLLAFFLGRPDPLAASSGVFRHGKLMQPEDNRMLSLADGKTATVSVFESTDGSVLTIAANGKPEAGLARTIEQAPAGDEVTMVIAGALPLALHPHPQEVGAIGWGSGLTTHTLLGVPGVRQVETIEIEPEMVEGARLFGERVARAYVDPRSHIVYEDARTYVAAGRRQYDVLVSEPSNPWVSGVASLFTSEFYTFAGRHLKPGGIFVQWLQSYEISDALQSRILSALLERFPYVDAYLAGSSDMVLVASASPLPPLDWRRLDHPSLKRELARVGLDDADAFTLRRLGGREVLQAYVRMSGGEAGHSDYYPDLALQAPRARFTNDYAKHLLLLATNGLPVLDLVDGRKLPRLSHLALSDNESSLVRYQLYAGVVNVAFRQPAAIRLLMQKRAPDEANALTRLLPLSRSRVPASALPAWSRDVAVLARYGPGALASEDLVGSWIDPTWLGSDQGPEVQAIMAAYRAAARRDAVAMRARAVAVLGLDAGLAPELREQMLVIAMSGAAGQKDRDGVRVLERRFGGALPAGDRYADLRRFLLAWADAPEK
jgi:predicted membrane-bound spermidine synthase